MSNDNIVNVFKVLNDVQEKEDKRKADEAAKEHEQKLKYYRSWADYLKNVIDKGITQFDNAHVLYHMLTDPDSSKILDEILYDNVYIKLTDIRNPKISECFNKPYNITTRYTALELDIDTKVLYDSSLNTVTLEFNYIKKKRYCGGVRTFTCMPCCH